MQINVKMETNKFEEGFMLLLRPMILLEGTIAPLVAPQNIENENSNVIRSVFDTLHPIIMLTMGHCFA